MRKQHLGWRNTWISVRITKTYQGLKKNNFRISSHVGSEHITVFPRAPITAGLGLFAPCKDRRGNIRRNNLRKVKQRRTHTEMSDSSVWQSQSGGTGWTVVLHFLPYCLSRSLGPQVTFVFGETHCLTASTYVVLSPIALTWAAENFGRLAPGWLNSNSVNGGKRQYWKIVSWVTCAALTHSKWIPGRPGRSVLMMSRGSGPVTSSKRQRVPR